ncbi:metastasis-suppressor KiSS-1 [Latimeria chalumnae]|uniref:metastasis-suppressor KiSS-1 n=1 Tax=Latimeria chalumnae TaxID=7897 RepID=UPI0003C1723F|nr:PREDICTED: metastasis-suppressor KiSS-1 [Latimeria chalumnae]|eukprot:XP_005991747.1 PREDICTED: metastasis-suppressor KiSS-1 [Latimeria chalumnae]
MSPYIFLFLMLFLKGHLGEPLHTIVPIQTPVLTGEVLKAIASGLLQKEESAPCLVQTPQSRTQHPKMLRPLVKLFDLKHGSRPRISRKIGLSLCKFNSSSLGVQTVKRENDLSSYNWNTFGLRYGKRQAGTLKAQSNIWKI